MVVPVVPGTRHLEGFVDDAIATLRRELNGRIAGINSLYDDFELDLVPDDDAAWVFGSIDGPPVVFPTVEVAAPDFTIRSFDIAQMMGDMDLPVVIRIWASDAHSASQLDRRLKRYGRAAISVLMERDSFGTHVVIDGDRGIRGAYRTNPETNEASQITGAVLLIFNLAEVEVAP